MTDIQPDTNESTDIPPGMMRLPWGTMTDERAHELMDLLDRVREERAVQEG